MQYFSLPQIIHNFKPETFLHSYSKTVCDRLYLVNDSPVHVSEVFFYLYSGVGECLSVTLEQTSEHHPRKPILLLMLQYALKTITQRHEVEWCQIWVILDTLALQARYAT